MIDLIKKTMLAGVGLAAMTKDKVEELAEELTEKGELSEKEAKELVEDLLKRSKRAKKDLNKKMEDVVTKVLKKMDVATKKDIARLDRKIKNRKIPSAGKNGSLQERWVSLWAAVLPGGGRISG
jgi:polyhydroxyalkanoate synthesis regulator phasin